MLISHGSSLTRLACSNHKMGSRLGWRTSRAKATTISKPVCHPLEQQLRQRPMRSGNSRLSSFSGPTPGARVEGRSTSHE